MMNNRRCIPLFVAVFVATLQLHSIVGMLLLFGTMMMIPIESFRPVDGFVIRPSSSSKQQLGNFVRARVQVQPSSVKLYPTEEDDDDDVAKAIAMEKATKAMTAFTNKYLELSCTKLCSDKSVPAVVIKGLAEHKVTLGAPLCPCRFYDNKEQEAKDGYWNCPCVPMRERQECHCMLFLTTENQFAGTEVTIDYNEVIELSKGMN